MNDIVMKIQPDAKVYVFTFQARNDAENVATTLTLGQLEAARNAAVSVLELVGATVDSTSSILSIDAPKEESRLVLTASVEDVEDHTR